MTGQLPKGSMQLAAGICGVGVFFAFVQGRSVPARLEDRGTQSEEAQKNNIRLQKMLHDLPNKTREQKMNDAMSAMANLHEVNRYNAEIHLNSGTTPTPDSEFMADPIGKTPS
eukprot:CAMPEP_0179456258 /NCGR_PEP_ID=MMETSP0799-20121207/40013_1 /TAXON_ID=46947 /ORGANISM="Geminigera cryophila, Strain CCMP2564" /LENGTH=112 /DNA_ID=CAMNT_0021255739 /DNA_START=16 /DNA_END=354 /DNA_ORIENTATION=-